MKATELRLGNRILIKGSNDNWIDATVDLSDLCFIHEFPEDCNSIPLTEEILSKCGFLYRIEFSNTYKWHLYEDGLRIAIYLDNGKYFKDYSTWICNPNTLNGWHVVGNISSLHQLQNLYFALTGKELDTSKLTKHE